MEQQQARRSGFPALVCGAGFLPSHLPSRVSIARDDGSDFSLSISELEQAAMLFCQTIPPEYLRWVPLGRTGLGTAELIGKMLLICL